MTNRKTTRRALFMSVISLMLCCAMLVGTTFAWFTDEVTSVNNIIKAGNLDVELYYSDDMSSWNQVTATSNVFDDGLWEPGHTEVVYLKVVNEGTLNLKYQLGVGVNSEVGSVNMAGKEFKLSDHIKYGVIDNVTAAYANREAAVAAVANATALNTPFNSEVLTLAPNGGNAVVALVVYMPETVGNEANYGKGQTPPTINLALNVYATQVEAEDDSFGDDYDADAIPVDILATPETIDDILASVEEGTVIGLSEGYYDEIVLTQDNLTLTSADGEATVGFLNLNAMDGAVINGLTFDESGAKQAYAFKTGNTQVATDYVTNITGDTDSPKAADNVVIKNCKFTNTSGVAVAADKQYIPIYFNEQGAATERATNITVTNCEFACNAVQYIGLNYLSEGNVVVTNNVFGGGSYGTSHNTINATGNAASWTITGNKFNNWNTAKTAIGSSKQGSNTVTWTVTGNEFTNKVDGAVVLALKTSYTADNSVVVIENNTAMGGKAQIVPTDVNAENETVYAGHKIQLNAGNTVVSNNEQLNDAVENATNGSTIIMPTGNFSLPTLSAKENVTIEGAADGSTVVGGESTSTGFNSNFGKNTTIKNVTFSGSSNGVRWSYANGGTSTFDNCTFAGDSTYGFHIDQSNGATFIFNNCTFVGFNAFAGDLEKVIFNNCTFLSNGNYGHTNIWSVAEFNNCTWGDATSVGQGKDSGAKLYFNGVEESYHHEYIGSAESLFAFAESVNEGGDSWKGQKVSLVADIDLENKAWTPIGQTGATEFEGIFDGQNHTIKNLNVDSSAQTGANYSSGLFGWVEGKITIKNVKIDGAKVVGNHNVAVLVGYTYSGQFSNIHVTNAEIVCNHANGDACGDKCGLIVGYAGDESRITDCSGSDSTVKAGRDGGQLIGAGYNVSVSGCSATNVTVSATGDCANEANINNAIIGRVLD